jgi:hypothetical protein
MSDIKIVSPSSGTATFTLTTPSGTSTDRTLTLPDQTSGTILTNESSTLPKTPVVALTGASQTTASSSGTYKVTSFNERADTHNIFNTSTNRITPTLAGYYFFYFQFTTQITNRNVLFIAKNGTIGGSATAVASMQHWTNGDVNNRQFLSSAGVVHMNGSTDYVDFWNLDFYSGSRTLESCFAGCYLVSGA